MKKIFGLFLLLAVIVFCAVSCGDTSTTTAATTTTVTTAAATTTTAPAVTTALPSAEATTTAALTTPEAPLTTATPATTEAPVTTESPIYVADIAENGKSEYVIVYDGSNDALTSTVKSYVSTLKLKFDISIKAKAIESLDTPYEKEIIVGDVGDKRPGMNAVKASCRQTGDFAITVYEDDVYLYATSDVNYRYLFAAMTQEESLKPQDKALSYSSDKPFFYAESNLKDTNFAEYKKQSGALAQNFVTGLFDFDTVTGEDGTTLPYRLYLPSNYDAEKEYPLLVVLHGAGERGNDNDKHMVYMFRSMFNHDNSPVTNAIILAPQCPENEQWVDTPWGSGNYSIKRVPESNELALVVTLVNRLKTDYSVDPDRVYAMGMSMGGYGTWDLLMRHGDMFAAGIPICGAGDMSMASALAKIPIYTFHGSADGVVPPTGTRAMANMINRKDPVDFHYEEFEGMDHGIWETVAARKDVIEWLFSQSKSN